MNNTQMVIKKYDILGNEIKFNFNELKENNIIEKLTIKNYSIDDDLIEVLNSMNNLKKICFIDCKFENNISLKKIEFITLQSCLNINKYLFNDNMHSISINNCKIININLFAKTDLQELKLEKVKIINIDKINNFKNLENLELRDTEVNSIDFRKFTNLKNVNLSGSIIIHKEEIIEILKRNNVNIVCMEKNLKIY